MSMIAIEQQVQGGALRSAISAASLRTNVMCPMVPVPCCTLRPPSFSNASIQASIVRKQRTSTGGGQADRNEVLQPNVQGIEVLALQPVGLMRFVECIGEEELGRLIKRNVGAKALSRSYRRQGTDIGKQLFEAAI